MARQVPRLAGLAGLKPCTPDCAAEPHRGVGRHAAWPGFYRRGTTGATARRSGVASCQLNRKKRRRAMGPPAHNKCQRDSKFTLAFWVAKLSKPCRSILAGAICVWIESNAEEKIKPVFLHHEVIQAAMQYPNLHWLSLPNATCGEAERR